MKAIVDSFKQNILAPFLAYVLPHLLPLLFIQIVLTAIFWQYHHWLLSLAIYGGIYMAVASYKIAFHSMDSLPVTIGYWIFIAYLLQGILGNFYGDHTPGGWLAILLIAGVIAGQYMARSIIKRVSPDEPPATPPTETA